MFDFDSIFNGVIANFIYSLLWILFLWFIWFKFYKNKNIKVTKSKIEDSFKWTNKNIDIKKSEIKNSFK